MKILRYNAAKRTQPRAFGSFSRSAGLVGIIAGLAALCGWSVLPAYVIRHLWFISQVHPNTGLGFILVGFSLRLARFDVTTPWVHNTCELFRISVGLLGLLSLTNIWFHLNLGIDKFIVRDPTSVLPGVMPAATALCFYILGCALILLSARRSVICQILSLTVTTIAVATLVASSYTLLAPQSLPDYLLMPPITALILLVLSISGNRQFKCQPRADDSDDQRQRGWGDGAAPLARLPTDPNRAWFLAPQRAKRGMV